MLSYNGPYSPKGLINAHPAIGGKWRIFIEFGQVEILSPRRQNIAIETILRLFYFFVIALGFCLFAFAVFEYIFYTLFDCISIAFRSTFCVQVSYKYLSALHLEVCYLYKVLLRKLVLSFISAKVSGNCHLQLPFYKVRQIPLQHIWVGLAM